MGSNCCKSTKVHIAEKIPNPNLSFGYSHSDIDVSPIQQSHQWRLGELIGQGTCGKVYQVMDEDTGQLLAVKIIKLHSDPQAAEHQFKNLTQEISLLKSLRNTHIVKYFQTEVFLDQRVVKILLEYVPGGSLRSILEKYGGLSQKVIKNYAYQIIKGLQYLHSHLVIHRDLKSANILVSDNAVVKLTDFGCSKKCEVGEVNLSMKGSPYWMAPEVVKQNGYSFSSDIWSYGCLLIEMATGNPPWSEYSTKASEIVKLIAIENKLPNFPKGNPELLELIEACVIRNPLERLTADQILKHPYFLTISTSCSHSFISKHPSFSMIENRGAN